MNIGFIGTGSMGSILIQALIESGAVQPHQVYAHNRTLAKAESLAERYSGLTVTNTLGALAEQSDILFICVKPKEFKKVIDELSHCLSTDQIVVSITSPVEMIDLEKHLPCKIAKIIPSITHSVFSGPSLCMYGQRITPSDQEQLEKLFSFISKPLPIDEKFTRVSSDLSSCSPAFMSFILQKLAEAAHEETGIPLEEAASLVTQMALGLGKLLTEGGFTMETLQQRVSVPGGITAEGLNVLKEAELESTFKKLFQTTHAKFEEDLSKVRESFYGK